MEEGVCVQLYHGYQTWRYNEITSENPVLD